MTTLYANADAIRAEARELDPVKVLLTLVLLPFFVVGFSARFAWVVISMVWTGCVYGWRVASKRVDPAGAHRPSGTELR
jgi:hypothetical protein